MPTDPVVEVPSGSGVMIRCDGGVRFITETEVREMTETDEPVTVR